MLPYTGHFAQQNSGAGHSPLLLFIIHGGAMNTVPRGYSAQPEIRRWRMSGSWWAQQGSVLLYSRTRTRRSSGYLTPPRTLAVPTQTK